MQLTKELLKSIIKEELQKAMLGEAETKDPGLNPENFPETLKIVDEIKNFLETAADFWEEDSYARKLNINPQKVKEKIIRIPGLLAKLVNQMVQKTFYYSDYDKKSWQDDSAKGYQRGLEQTFEKGLRPYSGEVDPDHQFYYPEFRFIRTYLRLLMKKGEEENANRLIRLLEEFKDSYYEELKFLKQKPEREKAQQQAQQAQQRQANLGQIRRSFGRMEENKK